MSTISKSNNSVQINGAPLTTTLSAANSTLLTSEIDNRVVKIRPMATPIDQLSRCGDVRHSGSMKVQYYTADVKDVSTQLSADLGRTDFTAPSSYSGGSIQGGVLKLKVKNPAIFSVSETIMVPSVVVKDCPLVLYVTEVGADHIMATLLTDAESYETDIQTKGKAGAEVVRMGRAAAELDVQTPQYETLPRKSENYCQIFKMQIEESTLHRLSNKEAAWGFSDQEEVAIIDMRQGMEKNFIFGIKCRMEGIGGKDELYFTGGIWNQPGVDTMLYSSDSLNEATLISMCRQAFTGGKGSARKILMGGSDFIEALSRLECNRIVIGNTSLVRWGLEFREIKSNFGTLYVIHNEIFDQCGHSADAMIIDPNMLTKYVHIPFSTEKLDLRTSGTRNTNAVVITEAACLVLRNPQCHLKIQAV